MSTRGRVLAVIAALACVGSLFVAATPAEAAAMRRPGPPHVGSLTLHRCDVVARALCGSIRRSRDPANPRAGTVKVGFAFVPARNRKRQVLGTLVPHEGGPGYSTTGTGTSYAEMYGPLLRRRNLLLVDQRGTGRSQPISCPALQNLTIAYNEAARRCGRSLGSHADDYTTALSADDLAAVITALGLGRVDLYGDSYGTFFTQVFTGRHPSMVRTLVVDSAYPAYGESAWYPTQGPALREAFDAACRRSTACRSAGEPFLPTLVKVLRRVRGHPWRGVSHDADGRRAAVVVNGVTLTDVAFGATFTPTTYRELTAALRSGLEGDRAPLLRLVAEALGGGTDAGDPVDYSEGLDAAVACHDYPQLYDMRAPPGAVREQQYRAALADRTRTDPYTYGPFTVHEYARTDWQTLDWCTRWPIAPAGNAAGPPRPPGGRYPNVPVLVLSGELDTITTPAEGKLVTTQFPNAQQVLVRNSMHVTAVGDTDNCARQLVRTFVFSAGQVSARGRACAQAVPPIRTLGTFPRTLADVNPAASGRGMPLRIRQAGPAAAATVTDLVGRWWNNYSGHGFGLRGGRWSFDGDRTVRFKLHRVRLVAGVVVSGRATWARYGRRMQVRLQLRGTGPHGRLHGAWQTRRVGATAVLKGHLNGHTVRLRFPAP
jgi:pimeloyl-ACP methyl ester carboxylesterase